MSSHREAPEISKDPAADNTDVYAFVSPDRSGFVTILANYIPLQGPNGGPNFFEFADDVLYEIHISHSANGQADITYQFRFETKVRNPHTFLYNTGPITEIDDPSWNRPQHYSITRVSKGRSRVIARHLAVPPVNVGKRSCPDYAHLSAQAVHHIQGARTVFAGQRADAFHVDLGSVFDLVALRPFNTFHAEKLPVMAGMNGLQSLNVHTIALQVPKKDLTAGGHVSSDVMDRRNVIGVWASASRQATRIFDKKTRRYVGHGPWQQVSRLGNPLFNEVLVPMVEKDDWNSRKPRYDQRFAKYVDHPELGRRIPELYPGVFPHLAAYEKVRKDMRAIFLTGFPPGIVPGFQNRLGTSAAGTADMLRLNVAVPPTKLPNDLGLVAGDLAGFPNGRRVNDDAVTIEVRMFAGATIPLFDKTYSVDAPALLVMDGSPASNGAATAHFPYLALPNGGYQTNMGTSSAS